MSQIRRGDTTVWDIPITRRADGGPYPLNGCVITVTSKRYISDTTPAYQHSIVFAVDGSVISSDGMALGSGGVAAGIVVETLSATESAGLAPGSYRYDVQVTQPDGQQFTPSSGTETVSADVGVS